MGEDTLLDFGPVEDKMQGIIKVIGVGGGGCNAVRNMYLDKVGGVTYAVMNTDSQSLSRSPVPYKIQLGAGLGAGGNPEQGKRECEESPIASDPNLLDELISQNPAVERLVKSFELETNTDELPF